MGSSYAVFESINNHNNGLDDTLAAINVADCLKGEMGGKIASNWIGRQEMRL